MIFPEGIAYKIVRSRRRSISLEIDKYGKLTMRMPLRLPENVGLEFIREKSSWIRKKMETATRRVSIPKTFSIGEEFLFLGNKYPLLFVPGRKSVLIFGDGFFRVPDGRKGEAKKMFKDFYKKAAADITGEIAEGYRKRFNLQYEKIKITSAKTRWGSCSNKGNISFSWKLIMSPLGVVEYVVVHEMAHLKHGNHSRRFWLEVKRMLPDYEVRKKWLKENGHFLTLD